MQYNSYISTILKNPDYQYKENIVILSFLCLKYIQLTWDVIEIYPDDIIYNIIIIIFNDMFDYPCDDNICKYYWYIEYVEYNEEYESIEDLYHCCVCHKINHYDYMQYITCDACNLKFCTDNCGGFIDESIHELSFPCENICSRCSQYMKIRKGNHYQWVRFNESLVNDHRRFKPNM